jgi:hypothetical protein
MSFSSARVARCRRSMWLRSRKFGKWRGCRLGEGLVYTWRCKITPPSPAWADGPTQVGTWLSLVERTLGVGEVASSNLVVPTI